MMLETSSKNINTYHLLQFLLKKLITCVIIFHMPIINTGINTTVEIWVITANKNDGSSLLLCSILI